MKQIFSLTICSLTIVGLLCVLCVLCVSVVHSEDKLAITEIEKLRYGNMVTRLQLVRLNKDALIRQFRDLQEEEKKLELGIPAMLKDILKAHGHPDGSVDWDKLRVIPKPPEPDKKAETKP